MSRFQNNPPRASRQNSASQSSGFHDWNAVPPPRRDQRPRPVPPRSPQPKRNPIAPSPAVSASEIMALRNQMMDPPVPFPKVTPSEQPHEQPSRSEHPKHYKRLMKRWTLWGFLILAGLGGIAGASAVSLFRIPNLPNCRAIFWPTASAATRLQCADAYADQATVENLLAAIDLVAALPDDHPLRSDIDERVEIWAEQILDIADQTFHEGDLEEAIKIARKIPQSTAAADEVSDRVDYWQDVWDQAESIYKEAEGHLKASQFQKAFSSAIQLRSVENDYWSTTRYEKLIGLIATTRQDVKALADAERLADTGTVEAVLEALEKVTAIDSESYAYDEAQSVFKKLSRRLLDLAEEALARQDSAGALDILGKIPSKAGLGPEIADFRVLIDAYELTWAGTTAGYESAIVRLQSIGRDRPLYSKAQALKRDWQWELEAVAQLNWAKRVARPGTASDLRAAIAEAEKIGASNPLWEETQTQIQRWRADIAEIEDRPFLDRAEALASQGDRRGLQSAVSEAENILPSSPLYDEAQDSIADWRWRIQEIDNEPILAQARQLAQAGNLSDAIAVASQIPANQAFYEEAQDTITTWQDEQEGRQSYQRALDVAQSGSVEALADAIALAQAIPESSADWNRAQQTVNQWSWDLLQMAETAAEQDVLAGIAIAGQIPPRTEAYAQAQLRIQEWQTSLDQG